MRAASLTNCVCLQHWLFLSLALSLSCRLPLLLSPMRHKQNCVSSTTRWGDFVFWDTWMVYCRQQWRGSCNARESSIASEYVYRRWFQKLRSFFRTITTNSTVINHLNGLTRLNMALPPIYSNAYLSMHCIWKITRVIGSWYSPQCQYLILSQTATFGTFAYHQCQFWRFHFHCTCIEHNISFLTRLGGNKVNVG